MLTIPNAVEEVIKKKPFLEGALVEGLVNLSALARQLKPEIEKKVGKEVNDSAVIMALNRLVPRLELMSAMKFKKVVENIGDIIVRSNLVVLLDEPYSGLDPHAMHIFDELIASVRENRTFVMVSHDLDKGLALASHVLVLARGRVVHFGEKDQMSPDEFADLYRTTVGMGVS